MGSAWERRAESASVSGPSIHVENPFTRTKCRPNRPDSSINPCTPDWIADVGHRGHSRLLAEWNRADAAGRGDNCQAPARLRLSRWHASVRSEKSQIGEFDGTPVVYVTCKQLCQKTG